MLDTGVDAVAGQTLTYSLSRFLGTATGRYVGATVRCQLKYGCMTNDKKLQSLKKSVNGDFNLSRWQFFP